MKFIIIFFLSAFSLTLLSQNSMDRDVPEVVQNAFSRKFPRAENVSWDKIDNNYKVDCFYRGQNTYAEFTPEGEWILTVVDTDPKDLYPPILKYLDENFQKDKVILVEKATCADRQDYYYVQVARKEKGQDEPYIFELFFDKTGKIEEVKAPEGVDDMTIVGIDDRNADIPADVIDSWQKRFPKSEGIDWTKKVNTSDTIDYNYVASFFYRESKTKAEFLPNGYWVETRVEYDEKDLYLPVVKYIEENHWNDDLIIAEKVTRADRQDYYYARLERMEKGQFRPYVFELYFDKAGKIQKVIRPEALKNQYLLTVDIPPAVAKKFKSRFSTAQDVTWETNEGNWVAKFVNREQTTTAIFSDSAQWVSTVVQLDPKDLYGPIQRTLDQQYADYNVMYAEKTTRSDRNDSYYLELISKKKNLEPQKISLFFDKTGRLKED
ncbi:MAG: PepSY-like domain-containing protein [Bacteroidales bacterium]|nr:PepSY-like domain-containing protein [Bacteroidales bacterium]